MSSGLCLLSADAFLDTTVVLSPIVACSVRLFAPASKASTVSRNYVFIKDRILVAVSCIFPSLFGRLECWCVVCLLAACPAGQGATEIRRND
ncbi:unnamed protein product [Bursaphelenchus xylophilus]|uniref:(pine wood nematode) hypothetical protein n=1 Tax=Bursaphelenchus xylophilus TaxID=6326 RepID=A0A1I7SJ76_BURXY|nr:unnamed protein product [Bursaphelenchus xylophilus]CAG9106433.1 unnamed protein product [Bursaphelenchus xylophilus]